MIQDKLTAFFTGFENRVQKSKDFVYEQHRKLIRAAKTAFVHGSSSKENRVHLAWNAFKHHRNIDRL